MDLADSREGMVKLIFTHSIVDEKCATSKLQTTVSSRKGKTVFYAEPKMAI